MGTHSQSSHIIMNYAALLLTALSEQSPAPLPAEQSPVMNARLPPLILLLVSWERRVLLSRLLFSSWLSAPSSLLRLTAREPWTCGSLTWPPASTTTSSWSRTCVVSWVSATRMTRELLLETGRVTSVWISCPEHQSTWPDLRPLMLELLTSRASVSVVSLDTLMTARA